MNIEVLSAWRNVSIHWRKLRRMQLFGWYRWGRVNHGRTLIRWARQRCSGWARLRAINNRPVRRCICGRCTLRRSMLVACWCRGRWGCHTRRLLERRRKDRGGSSGKCPGAQMMYKFRQTVLNGHLGVTNLYNVSFKAANSSVKYSATDQGYVKGSDTYSNPASPVRVASREGFSKRHSSPAFRQRLHGGLSAPSHLIFCFLQAFW